MASAGARVEEVPEVQGAGAGPLPSRLLAQAATAGAHARCGDWGHRPDAVWGTGSWFSCFRGLSFLAAGWDELGQAISLDAGL